MSIPADFDQTKTQRCDLGVQIVDDGYYNLVLPKFCFQSGKIHVENTLFRFRFSTKARKKYAEKYLRTLRRILFRSNLAIRAPVAVVYDGGGVYFGGASSKVNDTGLLSNVTAIAGIDDDPVAFSDCLLFEDACALRSVRGSGYRCDRCDELIGGRYSS